MVRSWLDLVTWRTKKRGIENKSGLNIIKFTFNIYELVRIYVKLEKDEEVRFIRGDFFTFMKESCELLRNIFDINFLKFKFFTSFSVTSY